jgi:hypothetical protein
MLRFGGALVTLGGQAVPLPIALFAYLPFGDVPRAPARFAIMAILGISVLAALGAWQILEVVSARWQGPLGAAMVAVVLLDSLALPFPTQRVVIPQAYRWLATRCASPRDGASTVLLELPIPDDPFAYRQRMLYQTVHGCPVFGGFVARGLPPLPFAAIPGFAQLRSLSSEVDDVVRYSETSLSTASLTALASYQTGYVVIDKRLFDERGLAQARQAWAAIAGDESSVFEDSDTVVYEVPQGVRAPIPILWLDRGWSYREGATDGVGDRWRWMANDATLRVSVPLDGTYVFTVKARSLKRPRRLSVRVGDSKGEAMEVGSDSVVTRSWELRLAPGVHEVRLSSLDGAEVAGHGDRRQISVALFDAEIRAASTGTSVLNSGR